MRAPQSPQRIVHISRHSTISKAISFVTSTGNRTRAREQLHRGPIQPHPFLPGHGIPSGSEAGPLEAAPHVGQLRVQLLEVHHPVLETREAAQRLHRLEIVAPTLGQLVRLIDWLGKRNRTHHHLVAVADTVEQSLELVLGHADFIPEDAVFNSLPDSLE